MSEPVKIITTSLASPMQSIEIAETYDVGGKRRTISVEVSSETQPLDALSAEALKLWDEVVPCISRKYLVGDTKPELIVPKRNET